MGAGDAGENAAGKEELIDVPFLQLAVAGGADYLVTGDRDLLSLAPEFFCLIVKVDAFMDFVEDG